MAAAALVVLDLNGVLMDRRRTALAAQVAQAIVARTHVYVRPHARDFIAWLRSRGVAVAVWTSAKADNAARLSGLVFDAAAPPEFLWDQGACGPAPTLAKDVARVYAAYPQFQGRTILVDDSGRKMRGNDPASVHIVQRFDAGRQGAGQGERDAALAPGGPVRASLDAWLNAPAFKVI